MMPQYWERPSPLLSPAFHLPPESERQALPAFMMSQFFLQPIFAADQKYPDLMMLGGLDSAFDFRLGSVIAFR